MQEPRSNQCPLPELGDHLCLRLCERKGLKLPAVGRFETFRRMAPADWLAEEVAGVNMSHCAVGTNDLRAVGKTPAVRR
jgi:hypothetical protein